jgi:hypothetical protein
MDYIKLINDARGHLAFMWVVTTQHRDQFQDHVKSTVIHLRRFADQAEKEGDTAAAESLRGTADAFESGNIR